MGNRLCFAQSMILYLSCNSEQNKKHIVKLNLWSQKPSKPVPTNTNNKTPSTQMLNYNHFSCVLIQRNPHSRSNWRYLYFMLRLIPPFFKILFAFFAIISTNLLSAQQFKSQDANGAPVESRSGSPQSGERPPRGGFRITANGQCQQLNANGDLKPLQGAIISMWIPNDTNTIGLNISILANGKISDDSKLAYRPIKRRVQEGELLLSNGGIAESDSQGKYSVRIPLQQFTDPRNPQDFMAMRAAITNSKTKALYFLLVATHDNGTHAQRWINLHDYIDFSKRDDDLNFEFTLPNLNLMTEVTPMEGAFIKVQAVTIKGDTTEMNGSSFKVNPDASAEDLVSKMPGVTSSNGQIQAQGEQVKKVLVDGKPFFGEDPNAALKNLPAEVVGKIQIYDAKSEQSLFSGIDDGNTTKTMNIVTKSQFRNGLFGRGFAGYGQAIDGTGDLNKYKAGVTINSFKGNRRLTFLSQLNNINEQNFSFEDLMGGAGGGGRGGMSSGGRGMGGMGGMGSAGNFFTGNQNGITTTRAVGLNYSNQWGKNTEFSGSYFFNSTDNNNRTETNRYYVGGDAKMGGFNYLESNPNSAENNSHRINGRLNLKLDSTNTLLIEPRLSLQQNNSSSPIEALTTNGLFNTVSSLLNNTQTNTSGYRASSSFLYRHAFEKKGRTISTEINPGVNGQSGLTNLNFKNLVVLDTNGLTTVNNRDQRTDLLKQTHTFSGNVTFTEALDSNHFLAASISTNINQNNNDRLAYLKDATTLGYTLLDTFFSSQFVNGYSQQKGGLSYRYQTYKWNVTTGIDAQLAQLDGSQSMPRNSELDRSFTSLLPYVQARYNLGMKRNLRLNYNTSNNAPSIDQLQPVINNNNTMQLSSGNPNLVQDYQHSLFLRYFSVVPESGKNVFWMINAQQSNNFISNKSVLGGRNASWIRLDSAFYGGGNGGATGAAENINDSIQLTPGAQMIVPINLNGYYSLRLFGSWGKTIKKMNVNTTAGLSTNNIPSMIQIGNGKSMINNAKNPSVNAGLVLGSNISERLDFSITGNGSYSKVINTLQKANDQTYLSYSGKLVVNWMPKASWVINSDVTYQAFEGLSASFNQSYYLWNAGLGYKFGKGKAAELRLTAYDILNQNRSIQRNVTQTYYEDVKTTVLTRYVMMTFSYKLRKFNGKGADGKDMKMMFPSGMPPTGVPAHRMGSPGR